MIPKGEESGGLPKVEGKRHVGEVSGMEHARCSEVNVSYREREPRRMLRMFLWRVRTSA